jgi:hypothetical protein
VSILITIFFIGTLHEMLEMVLLLLCMWNESRRRNDSNRTGNASCCSAPLVHFLRRIEKIGKSTEDDLNDEGSIFGSFCLSSLVFLSCVYFLYCLECLSCIFCLVLFSCFSDCLSDTNSCLSLFNLVSL